MKNIIFNFKTLNLLILAIIILSFNQLTNFTNHNFANTLNNKPKSDINHNIILKLDFIYSSQTSQNYKKNYQFVAKENIIDYISLEDQSINKLIFGYDWSFSAKILDLQAKKIKYELSLMGFSYENPPEKKLSDFIVRLNNYNPFTRDFIKFTTTELEKTHGKRASYNQLDVPIVMILTHPKKNSYYIDHQALVDKYFSSGKTTKNIIKKRFFNGLQDYIKQELYAKKPTGNNFSYNLDSLFKNDAALALKLSYDYLNNRGIPSYYITLKKALDSYYEKQKTYPKNLHYRSNKLTESIIDAISKKLAIDKKNLLFVFDTESDFNNGYFMVYKIN